MSNFVFIFSFSFSFLHQFVRGFKGVIVADYFNKLTTSDIRATVLSIESFVSRLIYALILPVIGWMIDLYSITQVMMVLAFTTLMIGVIVLVLLRRYRLV